MGLDFIRDKGQRFVQKRDDSRSKELDVEDLLSQSKPDKVEYHFRCQLEDHAAILEPGMWAVGRAMLNGEFIILMRGKRIGHVLPSDIPTLVAEMKRNQRHGGIISLIIVEGPSWDGVFVVKPKRAFK